MVARKPARPRRKVTKAPAPAKPRAARTKPAKPRAARPATLKTRPTDASVAKFLARVDARRRPDCQALVALLSRITREPPRLWGTSVVGFGTYRYTYASGHSGEWMRVGFSPRVQKLTIYFAPGFAEHKELLARLGTYTAGKGCLYVRSLADIDLAVLARLVRASVAKLPA
ncbi:MAG: DUF1801 domain-containing protein [Kofleriaceae bacterium]